jgi:hypothetical protein
MHKNHDTFIIVIDKEKSKYTLCHSLAYSVMNLTLYPTTVYNAM